MLVISLADHCGVYERRSKEIKAMVKHRELKVIEAQMQQVKA